MSKEGQERTKAAYSNPDIVAGYLAEHGKNPKLATQVEQFAQRLSGKRVIDIGCGTGHDSYHFSELGYEVTGVDYSPEMIRAAQTAFPNNSVHFEVLDMREIGEKFAENSFDGAWISASLLHVPEKDVPKVLKGIQKIIVNGGKVYIGLKAGRQGAAIVSEDKYGAEMGREFIFWEEENFRKLVEENGFKIEKVAKNESGQTGGKATSWLNFWLEVEK